MSLFNKLLKKAVNKMVDTVVDTVTDTVAEKIGREKQVTQAPRPSQQRSGFDAYCYTGSVEAYFAELIAQHFPEFTVSRNVSVAGSGNVPVTFLLQQGGKPVLALILCSSQEYRRLRVVNTVSACEARNIPVQRYYREFRNDSAYVIDRIRKAL